MSAPHDEGSELLQEVVALAATDMEFRARLLADPAPAIEERFGVKLPGSFRIGFVERPAHLDRLVLLPDPVRPGGELDEDDLDMVAGGTEGCTNNTTTW